jgi:hypothetical protein
MTLKKTLVQLALAAASLWLAGCQTVVVPPVYTLAPTQPPGESTQAAPTQIAVSPAAETATLTPVDTATPLYLPTETPTDTPLPTATPLPTFTPAPPTNTSLPASTFTPAPPTLTFTGVPPTLTFTPVPPTLTFTPVPPTLTPGSTSANLIVNPSFEGGWTVSPAQEQIPNGWQLYSPAAGQTMPFPTKLQQGNTVAAVADDYPESQHWLSDWLPQEEHLGQSRALILDGNTVLRTHGAWRASAVVLRQTISAPAGAQVRARGYILAESLGPGTKEADDLVAALRLYGVSLVEDKRTLAVMQTRNDVANSSRHWNRFEVVAQAPASGQLQIEVVLQQNWGLESEWFFTDNFSAAVQP